MNSDRQLAARRLISLLDLTSLSEHDTDKSVQELCAQGYSGVGPVAGVCVYPAFVSVARSALADLGRSNIRVVTVANFPEGQVDLLGAQEATEQAIADGADEIDLVFPWRSLMAGDWMVGEEMVQACSRSCSGRAKLKVIIESGQLVSPVFIRQASEICIQSGADFIKTSTGKTSVGATTAAVRLMAETLQQSGSDCGLKLSGGIDSFDEVTAYLNLVEDTLGKGWATPDTFRIEASSLLNALHKTLNQPID